MGMGKSGGERMELEREGLNDGERELVPGSWSEWGGEVGGWEEAGDGLAGKAERAEEDGAGNEGSGREACLRGRRWIFREGERGGSWRGCVELEREERWSWRQRRAARSWRGR